MEKLALFARLEAKTGKEKEVENFLKSGLSLAEQESKTNTWFGLKLGPSTYGIFDTSEDKDGRNAHLNGKIAEALKEKSGELLANPPQIEKVDLLAVKMP